MSTWCLRRNMWNTKNIAAIQVMRCLAPTQRYGRAWRIARCAGWHCRGTLCWTSSTCWWSGMQDSDCRDVQKTLYERLCVLTSRCGKESDCYTSWRMCVRYVMGNWHWGRRLRADCCQAWTKSDWVQVHTVLLELCMGLEQIDNVWQEQGSHRAAGSSWWSGEILCPWQWRRRYIWSFFHVWIQVRYQQA